MTLRTRLVVAAAYLLVVVVIAFEVPVAVTIDRRGVTELRAEILKQTAVAAARVGDPLARIGAAGSGADDTSIGSVVTSTASQTGARVVIVDREGMVVADSSGEAPPGTLYATTDRPEFAAALGGRITSSIRHSDTVGGDLVVATVPVWEGQTVVGAVRSTAPLSQVRANVHRAWIGLAGIGLAVILVGLVLAWLLATSLARPVQALDRAAGELGAGDLDARATPEGPEEIASLAESFNRMAVALGSTVRSQRDFVANASHQLRTPLTGLRLRLEAVQAEGGQAAQEAGKALAEVDRLSALVDDLLRLQSATAPGASGERTDLAEAARDAVDRWDREAERAGMTLRVEAPPAVPAPASGTDLAQVLDNLIENAIRYGERGGTITVSASDGGGGSLVAVSDNGPGIPAEERDRVFERFYRGSDGRRHGSGTGLGLAIVGELAGRWGGDARLGDSPEGGTRVEVRLPPCPPTVS
jgi:two-component system, OmpR family, sensor kinase